MVRVGSQGPHLSVLPHSAPRGQPWPWCGFLWLTECYPRVCSGQRPLSLSCSLLQDVPVQSQYPSLPRHHPSEFGRVFRGSVLPSVASKERVSARQCPGEVVPPFPLGSGNKFLPKSARCLQCRTLLPQPESILRVTFWCLPCMARDHEQPGNFQWSTGSLKPELKPSSAARQPHASAH